MSNFQMHLLVLVMIVMFLLVTMIFIQQLRHSKIINQLKTEKADKHNETYAKLLMAVEFIENVADERVYESARELKFDAIRTIRNLGEM